MSYQPTAATTIADLVRAHRVITARVQVASDRRRTCSSLDPAAAREFEKAEQSALDDRRTAVDELRDRGHHILAAALRREAEALRALRNSLEDVAGAGDGSDGLVEALNDVKVTRAAVDARVSAVPA